MSSFLIRKHIKIVNNTNANSHYNEGDVAESQSRNFMGYQTGSVTINVSLEKKQKITSVLLNFLRDYGSWIFLPQSIPVYYFDDNKNEFEFLTAKEIVAASSQQNTTTVFEKLNTNKKVLGSKIKIVKKPWWSIPAWHPGKGQHGWMFIDEIKIY